MMIQLLILVRMMMSMTDNNDDNDSRVDINDYLNHILVRS